MLSKTQLRLASSAALALGACFFCSSASADVDSPSCAGSIEPGATVHVAGSADGLIVQGRLAVVAAGKVVGILYIDEHGQRFLQASEGSTIPGFASVKPDGMGHPLPFDRLFGGDATLRACRPQ